MKTNKIILTILIIISSMVIPGCQNMFIPEPDGNPESIFEYFWQTFNDDYALFEERNVNWDSMYYVYRPMVHAGTTELELFNILTELILPLNDGHISIIGLNNRISHSNIYLREEPEKELFDIEIIKTSYLSAYYKSNNNKYIYGKINNHNIAYIHFDEFRESSAKLDQFLSEFANSDGYIVDLRGNKGGDVSHSFNFLSRFTPVKTLFLKSKTKNGKGKNDYTPWYNWYLTSSNKYLNKPLIVLTDRYTVSAAERMVMAARSLPNTIVIGDTTNGTFGTKISKELPNGWFFSYSIQKVIMFDGNSYEGTGLPPDIRVKNSLEDISSGRDLVLQAAIDLIK